MQHTNFHQAITSCRDEPISVSVCRLAKALAKPRAVLTKAQAIAIFQLKHKLPSATKVARSYGVSEKAVRDIWTARTWATETWHLDPSRTLKIKHSGRPLGSRDSKPRKPRQVSVGGSALSPATPHCTLAASHDDDLISCGSDSDIADLCEERSAHIECFDADHLGTSWPNECCAGGRPGDHGFLRSEQHPLVPTISIDEQLFDWEHRGQGVSWSDPFQTEWCGLSAVRSVHWT